MSVKIKTTNNLAARNAVVATFVNVLSSHETSGNIVTQVCNTAAKWFKGEEIDAATRASIITDIAVARGWKGDSVKVRSSECNAVLKAYTSLPEAVKLFANKNHGAVQWHNSLSLARQINKGESVTNAVKNALSNKPAGNKGTPSGRVAGALKAWFKDARPDKKAAILKAADLLGIKLGIKLDA